MLTLSLSNAGNATFEIFLLGKKETKCWKQIILCSILLCVFSTSSEDLDQKSLLQQRVGEDPSRTSGDLDNFQMEEEEKEVIRSRVFRGFCCCKVFMICASVSRNLLPVRTFQVNFPMAKADFLLIFGVLMSWITQCNGRAVLYSCCSVFRSFDILFVCCHLGRLCIHVRDSALLQWTHQETLHFSVPLWITNVFV